MQSPLTHGVQHSKRKLKAPTQRRVVHPTVLNNEVENSEGYVALRPCISEKRKAGIELHNASWHLRVDHLGLDMAFLAYAL